MHTTLAQSGDGLQQSYAPRNDEFWNSSLRAKRGMYIREVARNGLQGTHKVVATFYERKEEFCSAAKTRSLLRLIRTSFHKS